MLTIGNCATLFIPGIEVTGSLTREAEFIVAGLSFALLRYQSRYRPLNAQMSTTTNTAALDIHCVMTQHQASSGAEAKRSRLGCIRSAPDSRCCARSVYHHRIDSRLAAQPALTTRQSIGAKSNGLPGFRATSAVIREIENATTLKVSATNHVGYRSKTANRKLNIVMSCGHDRRTSASVARRSLEPSSCMDRTPCHRGFECNTWA